MPLTAWRNVTDFHPYTFIQGEAPGSVVLVAGVTAVGMSPVELQVPHGQKGVTVGILGIPRLTLPTGFRHASCAAVVRTAVVITLVAYRRIKIV